MTTPAAPRGGSLQGPRTPTLGDTPAGVLPSGSLSPRPDPGLGPPAPAERAGHKALGPQEAFLPLTRQGEVQAALRGRGQTRVPNATSQDPGDPSRGTAEWMPVQS